MTEPSAALGREFGERLAVVGLQGSMRRGEATATSDIDILIVLDHLHAADVLRCRTVLDELPEGSRAHGFTCGTAELAAWPRSEIFAFAQDVRCYHGQIAPLLPRIEHQDVVSGTRMAVSPQRAPSCSNWPGRTRRNC